MDQTTLQQQYAEKKITLIDYRQALMGLGIKRFNTGAPCRAKGHISDRYTSTGGCIECVTVKRVKPPSSLQQTFTLHSYCHPQLSTEQKIDLEIYLWRCIVSWHESIGLTAPINPSTITSALAHRRSPMEFLGK